MKLIKMAMCAVMAAAAMTVTAVGSASAAPGMTTLAEAYEEVMAKARSGAVLADSNPFFLRVAGRGDKWCLDNHLGGQGKDNSPVGMWECNGGVSEVWRLRVFNNNPYNIGLVNEFSKKCLDYPASAGDQMGWQFNVYTCLGGASKGQNFRMWRLPNNDTVFESQATNVTVAMDAFADHWRGNGSPVGLWRWSNPGNKLQHWY